MGLCAVNTQRNAVQAEQQSLMEYSFTTVCSRVTWSIMTTDGGGTTILDHKREK